MKQNECITNDKFVTDVLANSKDIKTPAFVYDVSEIVAKSKLLAEVAHYSKCIPLFSIKSFGFNDIVDVISPYFEGISTSSLYESKSIRRKIGNKKSIHLITPGIKEAEIDELKELCGYITLNSLSSYERYCDRLSTVKLGLRINPLQSFADDPRYDPCKIGSKLGVPIDQLCQRSTENDRLLNKIKGIHFHNNCDSEAISELSSTVDTICEKIPKILHQSHWVNFGGGYLFSEMDNALELKSIVKKVNIGVKKDVFIEPGADIVRSAGFIVSSVIDIFESTGKTIAILDTSVNHMPEVYEYQYEPDVIGHKDEGHYTFILAGSTCLAGDNFGEYSFDKPLVLGQKIIFIDMGAYSLVKVNQFNGLPLPHIYAIDEEHRVVCKKKPSFSQYSYYLS